MNPSSMDSPPSAAMSLDTQLILDAIAALGKRFDAFGERLDRRFAASPPVSAPATSVVPATAPAPAVTTSVAPAPSTPPTSTMAASSPSASAASTTSSTSIDPVARGAKEAVDFNSPSRCSTLGPNQPACVIVSATTTSSSSPTSSSTFSSPLDAALVVSTVSTELPLVASARYSMSGLYQDACLSMFAPTASTLPSASSTSTQLQVTSEARDAMIGVLIWSPSAGRKVAHEVFEMRHKWTLSLGEATMLQVLGILLMNFLKVCSSWFNMAPGTSSGLMESADCLWMLIQESRMCICGGYHESTLIKVRKSPCPTPVCQICRNIHTAVWAVPMQLMPIHDGDHMLPTLWLFRVFVLQPFVQSRTCLVSCTWSLHFQGRIEDAWASIYCQVAVSNESSLQDFHYYGIVVWTDMFQYLIQVSFLHTPLGLNGNRSGTVEKIIHFPISLSITRPWDPGLFVSFCAIQHTDSSLVRMQAMHFSILYANHGKKLSGMQKLLLRGGIKWISIQFSRAEIISRTIQLSAETLQKLHGTEGPRTMKLQGSDYFG